MPTVGRAFFLLLQVGDGWRNADQSSKARLYYHAAVEYGTEVLAKKDNSIHPYLVARYGLLAWLNWPSPEDAEAKKYRTVVAWLKLSVTALQHKQVPGQDSKQAVWEIPESLKSGSLSKVYQAEGDGSSAKGGSNSTASQSLDRTDSGDLWTVVKTLFWWTIGLGSLLGLSRQGWEAMFRAIADFIRRVSFPQLAVKRESRKVGG